MKTGIRFTVKHEIRGRIRIHLTRGRLSIRQADLFSFYLTSLPQVTAAKVYERIGDAAISYTGTKEDLIAEILKFSFDDEKLNELVPTTGTRARSTPPARRGERCACLGNRARPCCSALPAKRRGSASTRRWTVGRWIRRISLRS